MANFQPVREDCKRAFRAAIERLLPVLSALGQEHTREHYVWDRAGEGLIRRSERRPDVEKIFGLARQPIAQESEAFAEIFFSAYPEFTEGLVMITGLCGSQLAHDRTWVVRNALADLWKRHPTFVCPEASVDSVVDGLAVFVDSSRVQILFSAPLQNFWMAADFIDFAPGLRIRRFTAEEIDELHGGDAHPWARAWPHRFRLTITGEFGAPYTVLASTNLVDWAQVGNVTNTLGTTQFTDPAATNSAVRFYETMGQ